ncbi:MAG: LysM peptidoglycan-binding domain-containing protein [Lachnospiraceae bacterium]|nr:LysM peptidoglycan-binding domain-containing protein [Butyrivibrio sp.]MCM1344847.1 LysM peptidoglycan-binding domain-containing protein [Muribaculaceae bacterium]MCM1410810.1 LysM peptidoglycan-binding domain-containing protein [Lachnospiraceae bacterium]
MRKRVITALLLAMALAFAPVSGELAMNVRAAENTEVSEDTETLANAETSGDTEVSDEPEIATVSGDAGGSGSIETTDKTQLAAPTGLQWGENGIVTWNAVEAADGYYLVELYKDGTPVTGSGFSGHLSSDNVATISISDIRLHINESGAYQFRVKSLASYDPDHYEDSEWSELSPVYDYVKPDAVLGTVTCYWSDTKPGTLCWPEVEGAAEYVVYVCYYGSTGNDIKGLGRVRTTSLSIDMTSWFEHYGAGKYRCAVKALSGDIETIAHGEIGGYSEYYDTAAEASTISGAISNAVGNAANASEALGTIKADIDKASLKTAMQTDNTVLNQIKDLESTYAAEQGITISAPVVSREAGAYVKADAISIAGAGLNAAAGQEVRLEVSVPVEKEDVPEQHYANSVQLDIQLKRAGASVHELDIPVTITIPVPAGLDAKRLVILHYSEDGSFETVNFRDNGNGTVTFTVSRFSTFAFAEQKTDESSISFESSDGGEANTPDAQEDIVNRIINAGSGETIHVKGMTALSNSVMQELWKKGSVTMVLEYTYDGVDYVVTIPAGAAVNDDIPWYGPLYLAGRYGSGTTGTGMAADNAYTVRSGDTMSRIARANGMTLKQLAEKNPQIKNIDYIVVGQKIHVR